MIHKRDTAWLGDSMVGRLVVVVPALFACALGVARADSASDARKHAKDVGLAKALEKAKTMPAITGKEFVASWRMLIDSYANAICACPMTAMRLDDNGNLIRRNDCVEEATDEFMLDLAEPSFRLPGMIELFTHNHTDVEERARKAVVDVLDELVPAKEQLRRANKLRECMAQVGIR